LKVEKNKPLKKLTCHNNNKKKAKRKKLCKIKKRVMRMLLILTIQMN
jgi:hypothetical protein